MLAYLQKTSRVAVVPVWMKELVWQTAQRTRACARNTIAAFIVKVCRILSMYVNDRQIYIIYFIKWINELTYMHMRVCVCLCVCILTRDK